MKALFLTFIDGNLMEIDTFSRCGGSDLNATAKAILEDYRYDYFCHELRCGIYIVTGTRLAFAGEEVMEGLTDED